MILGNLGNTCDRFCKSAGEVYAGIPRQYLTIRREWANGFNIESDPLEKNPLDANSKEAKELKFILSQHIRKTGAIPWEKPDVE